MAQAKQAGGLYYIGDTAVDADGKAVPDAPAKQPNTDPSKQPGAPGGPTPEEKLATAIAKGLQQSNKPKDKDEDEDEDDTLPVLAELPAHLATLTSLDEVKALKKRDKRVGAQDAYVERIAELKAE